MWYDDHHGCHQQYRYLLIIHRLFNLFILFFFFLATQRLLADLSFPPAAGLGAGWRMNFVL